MKLISDFRAWLSGPSAPKTSYDVYCLWQTCLRRSTGAYHFTDLEHGGMVIWGPQGDGLRITTPAALAAMKYAVEAIKPTPVPYSVWTELDRACDPKGRVSIAVKQPRGLGRFK